MDVSIIILNYKTPKMCCDCINSLINHSVGFSYEILVIDNDSRDNSREIIENQKFSHEVKYIQNNENLGTAKAFNEGAKLAKGNYLFYLNTDTLFVNNAINIMLKYAQSHTNVAIVGGNLYNSEMKPTHSYNKIYGIEYYKIYSSLIRTLIKKVFKSKRCDEFNYKNTPLKVFYVCAAATLIKKQIFTEIGGFNEKIFIYGDEALFALECSKLGFSSVNVPNAKIIHFEGNSFAKGRNDFSAGRLRRMLSGISIFFEEGYGKKGQEKYLRLFLKGSRKRKLFYLLFSQGKYKFYKCQVEEIKKFIKENNYGKNNGKN